MVVFLVTGRASRGLQLFEKEVPRIKTSDAGKSDGSLFPVERLAHRAHQQLDTYWQPRQLEIRENEIMFQSGVLVTHKIEQQNELTCSPCLSCTPGRIGCIRRLDSRKQNDGGAEQDGS